MTLPTVSAAIPTKVTCKEDSCLNRYTSRKARNLKKMDINALQEMLSKVEYSFNLYNIIGIMDFFI